MYIYSTNVRWLLLTFLHWVKYWVGRVTHFMSLLSCPEMNALLLVKWTFLHIVSHWLSQWLKMSRNEYIFLIAFVCVAITVPIHPPHPPPSLPSPPNPPRRVSSATTMTTRRRSRWSWWRMTPPSCGATGGSGTKCPLLGSWRTQTGLLLRYGERVRIRHPGRNKQLKAICVSGLFDISWRENGSLALFAHQLLVRNDTVLMCLTRCCHILSIYVLVNLLLPVSSKILIKTRYILPFQLYQSAWNVLLYAVCSESVAGSIFVSRLLTSISILEYLFLIL